MSGNERASGDRLGLSDSAQDVARLLAGGNLRLLGLLAGASNGTFLAEASGASGTTLAVYKPRDGEAPLWDFPEGTLWRREIAAYEVAAAFGWPDVPVTVEGTGPHGPGAVQAFVEHDPAKHFFLLRRGREATFQRAALFDCIVNNADRKGGHCLLGPDDTVYFIDHGTCFSPEPKLRTVIWDWAGEPLTPELQGLVDGAAELLRAGGPLRARLAELLSAEEAEATAQRAEALARARRFPEPGDERAVPWPPI